MKYLVIVFLCIAVNSNAFSQVDTTCLTNNQIIRISETIDSLEQLSQSQAEVIAALQKQTIQQDRLNIQNEMLLAIQDDEIKMTRAALEHSLDINTKIAVKKNWYESEYMYFMYGAVTIYAGALIVSLIR